MFCVPYKKKPYQTWNLSIEWNNEHGMKIRRKEKESERDIMCEQIAINLINIFFLFVPNTSTSSFENRLQNQLSISARARKTHLCSIDILSLY